jgi:anti-repressor protein
MVSPPSPPESYHCREGKAITREGKMNDLTIHNFKGWDVRTVIIDGDPWFVAVDVCNVLGLYNPSDAIKRLEFDEKSTIDLAEGKPTLNIISEAGLYSFIMRSEKSEAKAFRKWITHDVLPSIRKHGMYATPATVEAMIADPDFAIKTFTALKEERAGRIEAEQRVAVLEPKAQVLDAWTGENNKDLITIGALAKLINIPGLGQNNLFKFLRWAHILDEYNRPMQRYIDAGYMRSVEIQGWTEQNTGIYHPLYQPKVTPKGKPWVTRLVFDKYEQWPKPASCTLN